MRALVVGAGRMGTHHARVGRSLGMDVHTVDPFQPADFQQLEAAPEADLVVIATPIAALAPAACAAMRIGHRLLLVEKPMAASLGEAEDMVELAAETGTVLVVGYTERFSPAFREVSHDLIARIGTVEELRFERRGPRPCDASVCALDLTVHDLDLMRFLGYEPSVIEAESNGDAMHATLDCGGPTATVDTRYAPNGKVRRFSIRGSDGRIDCDLVAGVATLSTPAGTSRRAADPDVALVRQWLALAEGDGPSAADGLAALRLVAAIEALRRS
jgi:predicted dehydrogenase